MNATYDEALTQVQVAADMVVSLHEIASDMEVGKDAQAQLPSVVRSLRDALTTFRYVQGERHERRMVRVERETYQQEKRSDERMAADLTDAQDTVFSLIHTILRLAKGPEEGNPDPDPFEERDHQTALGMTIDQLAGFFLPEVADAVHAYARGLTAWGMSDARFAGAHSYHWLGVQVRVSEAVGVEPEDVRLATRAEVDQVPHQSLAEDTIYTRYWCAGARFWRTDDVDGITHIARVEEK